MQWLLQLIFRHRTVSSLLLTVICSLWMLSSGPSRQQQIARSLTMTVFFPFQFVVQQITRTRNIFAENRRLREELTQLRTSTSFLEEQAAENVRLRELLGYRDSLVYALVPSRVIAREPSHLFRSIVIDVGSNSGVELFMPVVTRRGVVGKVIQTMPHICLVQVLSDPSARVSVMTKRSRSVGILETENGRDFFISQRTHEDVDTGDTVITTGLGGIFPKGLLVGTVVKIGGMSEALFKKTFVKPSVDFDHLEEVFVMELSPQWTTVRRELDSLGVGR